MSLRLSLLRHGETERGGGFRGSLDDALTALGWQQMHAAVAGQGPWSRVLSSPLQRCARFAETLGLPLQRVDALRELHFGEWEGRSAADVHAAHEADLGRFWSDPYGFTPPGGEPLSDFAARVWAALESIRAGSTEDEHLLLVTHGGVMRLLLCAARGWPPERLLEVSVPHAALITLSYAEGRWQEVACSHC